MASYYEFLRRVKRNIDSVLGHRIRALEDFGVSPNHLTLMSLVFGALGLYFLFSNNLLGVAFIIVYFALDVFDGVFARVTGKVTEFGAWFDFLVDRCVAMMMAYKYYLISGEKIIPVICLSVVLFLSFFEE